MCCLAMTVNQDSKSYHLPEGYNTFQVMRVNAG